jgi:hypothetical protein
MDSHGSCRSPQRPLGEISDRLHRVLDAPGDELSARSGLVPVTDRLAAHLGGESPEDGVVERPAGCGICSTPTSSTA